MEENMKENGISAKKARLVVVNFGGQYAHLITKCFRALGFYAELVSPTVNAKEIADAKGIVLSGGPQSVYDTSIRFNPAILGLDVPILGLCYGHQLMAKCFGAKVEKAATSEFGAATLRYDGTSPLFYNLSEFEKNTCAEVFDKGGPFNKTTAERKDNGCGNESACCDKSFNFVTQVWMSHNDEVTTLPAGFALTGSTDYCKYAALSSFDSDKIIYAEDALEKGNKKPSAPRFMLQFHPEVRDSLAGLGILKNFATICKMEKNWDVDAVLSLLIKQTQEKARGKSVVLLLSGGVDSSVCFALLNKALGKERVLGVHIDNGFMRQDESKNVADTYKKMGMSNFISVDASGDFLKAVKGVCDPQEKRLKIGETFIRIAQSVFEKEKIDKTKYLLCQGTLYPDVIESGAVENSQTIKLHHNRAPAVLALQKAGFIIEPLAALYKDEVRKLGRALDLSETLIGRHPFPGPGLSINVLCSNGKVPAGYEKALSSAKKAQSLLGTFCIGGKDIKPTLSSMSVQSVGVQGDGRTYRFPLVVDFGAGLTLGEGGSLSYDDAERFATALINENKDFNRVAFKLWEREGMENFSLQASYCTKEVLDQVRAADKIALEVLRDFGWYDKIFQHLTIRAPFALKATHATFILRPLFSEDVMTARVARLPSKVLSKMVDEIKELDFVDAILLDATSKPPATFCWE